MGDKSKIEWQYEITVKVSSDLKKAQIAMDTDLWDVLKVFPGLVIDATGDQFSVIMEVANDNATGS